VSTPPRASRFRLAVAVLALVAAIVGTGCDRKAAGASAAPEAAPVPKKAAALGEGRLDNLPLIVRVTEVKRVGPDAMLVSLLLLNPDQTKSVAVGSAFAADEADAGSLADLYLLDEARRKKFFILRDDPGGPASSRDVIEVPAGAERAVWARFPAPPSGVQQITVQVPHLPPFRNLPIS
jgi:hypothetical protein